MFIFDCFILKMKGFIFSTAYIIICNYVNKIIFFRIKTTDLVTNNLPSKTLLISAAEMEQNSIE